MTLKCIWEELTKSTQIHVMTVQGCEPRPKIAAFDMDGTLICTKSGRVFPTNIDDWQLLYKPQVKDVMQKLHHEDGHKIVLITNQNGIGTGKLSLSDFRQKIEAIVKELDVPLQLFAATEKHCVFRKPRPGFWELLNRNYNGQVQIDQANSFYCGDAAGRIRAKGKKDFSCSDRLFAANAGLKFYVPEEIFLKRKCTEEIKYPDFNAKKFLDNPPDLTSPSHAKLLSSNQEVVLMVGVQGSGKSHFAEKNFGAQNYVIVSNDQTGGREKSLNLMKKALTSGKSVVVDNTHVNAEARQKFLLLAKSFNVPCRCFVMATSIGQVKHNIVYREIIDKEHVHIGDPLINGYLKQYKEPTLDEGFNEIVKVNVVPEFEFEEHQALYSMHLVEK